MKIRLAAALAATTVAAAATPAFAQEAESGPITISGSAALVSDYRFRGISMTDKEMAVQAGVTVAHESGFYVGAWGSNLAGWGTFAGSNMELDLIGGYSRLRTHCGSQKMTVAAMHMADMKVWAHRS